MNTAAGSLAARLKRGIFISSMMSRTTGAYCAAHGAGAAMVQIGALIADPVREHEEDYLLPEAEADMAARLRKDVDPIRERLGDVPICLNAAVGDLESGLKSARALRAAGGDVYEVNIHGGYGPMLKRGLLRAMALPLHRARLLEWLTALAELDTPVIVKFNRSTPGVDFSELLKQIDGIGLLGVHFNVRDGSSNAPDLDFVRTVRPLVPGVLLCSGYVRARADADALFDAGADCVGVAQGLLDDPGIIAKLKPTASERSLS